MLAVILVDLVDWLNSTKREGYEIERMSQRSLMPELNWAATKVLNSIETTFVNEWGKRQP